MEKILNILLAAIDPPAELDRAEIDPDYIQELANSIAEIGLLQPILLRPVVERYEIIAGHRRYLAFRLLGRVDIPAIVRPLDDAAAQIARATENLQRVDLTPIEEARIYSVLLNKHNMSLEAIGKMIGKSAGLVRRRMDLLRMPPQLQDAIHKRKIVYGVAESLWSLGDIAKIDYYLGFCIEHGATIEVVREWVREEQAKERQKDFEVEKGGGDRSPMERRPVFVPCDLCLEAMEIGQETVIRACPVCYQIIKTNM